MSALLRETVDSTFEPTLDDLIHPVDAEKFLREHWGKSLLVVHRHSPGFFNKLLSLADVDACLMTATNSSGNILHLIASRGSSRSTTLTPVWAVSNETLYSSFLAGDTIRLIGVEKFWPPVRRLCAVLQGALGASVGVNLFLTPAHSQAFPLHFDNTDAFIVQLAGSKRWQLWKPTYERPLDSPLSERYVAPLMEKDEAKLTLEEDTVLEAGDVLYMPRGFYHKAVALDELSLHLTISFHPASWVDFFKRAFELVALEEPELRQNLPPHFVGGRRAQLPMQREFLKLLDLFAEKASFEKTLESLAREDAAARVPSPDGHFAVLSRLEEIGASSRLEKRKGFACRVEESAEKISIQFGGQRVFGPRALRPAFEFIRDHERFRASDLPEVASLEGKLTLVRRLAREGLLRLADE